VKKCRPSAVVKFLRILNSRAQQLSKSPLVLFIIGYDENKKNAVQLSNFPLVYITSDLNLFLPV